MLASSIISQQLSVKAAKTIRGRILSLINENSVLDANKLIKIDITKLRKAGLSNSKATYMKSLSIAVENDDLNLNKLDRLTDNAIIN